MQCPKRSIDGDERKPLIAITTCKETRVPLNILFLRIACRKSIVLPFSSAPQIFPVCFLCSESSTQSSLRLSLHFFNCLSMSKSKHQKRVARATAQQYRNARRFNLCRVKSLMWASLVPIKHNFMRSHHLFLSLHSTRFLRLINAKCMLKAFGTFDALVFPFFFTRSALKRLPF